jgi:hypothetical protein
VESWLHQDIMQNSQFREDIFVEICYVIACDNENFKDVCLCDAIKRWRTRERWSEAKQEAKF